MVDAFILDALVMSVEAHGDCRPDSIDSRTGEDNNEGEGNNGR